VYTPQDVAHIVSYAGAVRAPFLPSFQHHDTYRTTFRSGELTFSSYVIFLGVRGICAKIERNVLMQEIDTPGHTAVISQSHPEHIACAEATPWTVYANEPPAGQLRLASPATVNFTVGMLSAVAELFPSTLFSTGGDEINARCYADDAQTQHDLDGRTLEQALDAFTQATHGALRKLGKTPVVWEGVIYVSSNCKGH
jgi:hexosaminidase